MIPVITAESVTSLTGVEGAVLVTGSHGGLIAASLAAGAGVRAVIFNDAGIGRDGAGIAGLAWLALRGMAAATVSHHSARIGDGDDALHRGIISHANTLAAALGIVAGMPCAEAARLLAAANQPPAFAGRRDEHDHGRFQFANIAGSVEIRGLDSIGLLQSGDAGCVLLIGSHGGLHGGRPESALPVAAAAALFNDAGVGMENSGIGRLAVLAARGIPAGAVDCMSARIGDARSMWATGLVTHINAVAADWDARPGMSARSFAELFAGVR